MALEIFGLFQPLVWRELIGIYAKGVMEKFHIFLPPPPPKKKKKHSPFICVPDKGLAVSLESSIPLA